MTEVDNIKTVLFNEHQGLSLEYLQKPKEVVLTEAPQRFSKLVNTNEVNRNAIQGYFAKLLSEDTLIGHDEFLFRKLDEGIKEDIKINSDNIIAENANHNLK